MLGDRVTIADKIRDFFNLPLPSYFVQGEGIHKRVYRQRFLYMISLCVGMFGIVPKKVNSQHRKDLGVTGNCH